MANENKTCEKSSVNKDSSVMYLHDFVYLLLLILVLLLVFFRIVIVSGNSMNATLVDGDYLLLKSNLFYKNPQYGDVVVVCKDSFKDGEPIVKRVIATEGQIVDIDFDLGIVYIDGLPLQEDYTNTPTNEFEGMTFPVIVEKNCVFVMGDNRNNSTDSRYPGIGQVDTREILGKVLFLAIPGTDHGFSARNYHRIGRVY